LIKDPLYNPEMMKLLDFSSAPSQIFLFKLAFYLFARLIGSIQHFFGLSYGTWKNPSPRTIKGKRFYSTKNKNIRVEESRILKYKIAKKDLYITIPIKGEKIFELSNTVKELRKALPNVSLFHENNWKVITDMPSDWKIEKLSKSKPQFEIYDPNVEEMLDVSQDAETLDISSFY